MYEGVCSIFYVARHAPESEKAESSEREKTDIENRERISAEEEGNQYQAHNSELPNKQ